MKAFQIGKLAHSSKQVLLHDLLPKSHETMPAILQFYSNKSSHTIFAWGKNDKTQLGLNKTGNQVTPVEIVTLKNKSILAVHGGYDFSIALDKHGHLYSFGSSGNGQCGHGDNKECGVPTLIKSLTLHKIIQFAVGCYHVLALTDQGQVYSWGYNDYGQVSSNNLIV